MISIFYARISEKNHDYIIRFYLEKYSEIFEDWSIIRKYVKWEDIQLTILGRLLLLEGLELLGYEIKNIKIGYNRFGKPFLHDRMVHFNISHSGYISVCAISNQQIGIDIEKKEIINTENFKGVVPADDFFNINSSENKMEAFYIYWTKCESLYKAHEQDTDADFKMSRIYNDYATLYDINYFFKKIDLSAEYVCYICTILEKLCIEDLFIKELCLDVGNPARLFVFA